MSDSMEFKVRRLQNLLRGAGSIVELWPARSLVDLVKSEPSDVEALREDWEAVGRDLKQAFATFARENDIDTQQPQCTAEAVGKDCHQAPDRVKKVAKA